MVVVAILACEVLSIEKDERVVLGVDGIADPVEPHTFWINPYAVHFGLLKVSDMVRVNDKGDRVDGAINPVNAAGFMIHSAIHQRRPDLHAACHMHSPYGRAWSTFGKGIDMLNQGTLSFPLASWPTHSLNNAIWLDRHCFLLFG